METSGKKGFKVSLILHGGFFGLLIFASLLQMCKRRPPAHVFTLTTTNPAPIEQKVAAPQPPKEEAKPQKKEQKPKETPPPPKPMSYAEFIKKQGKPKPVKKKTRSEPTKVTPVSTVDVNQFKSELEQIVHSSTTTSTASTVAAPTYSEINAYNQRLKAKIDSVYQKPAGGSHEGLAAVVQFSVAANGNIFDAKIVQSSGSEIFDGSVKQAFAKVSNAGRPPGGQGGTYQLTFKFQS